MSDSIRAIAERVQGINNKRKSVKQNRTLSLRTDSFLELQSHCKDFGVSMSEVIDDLIEAYLNQVNNIRNGK